MFSVPWKLMTVEEDKTSVVCFGKDFSGTITTTTK
jgi:hypothetical protein